MTSVAAAGNFDPAAFAQQRQAAFQKADANKDGGLSIEEFSANRPQGIKAPNGAPSVEEAFANLDGDSDGFLTFEELEGGFEALQSQFQGGGLTGSNILQLAQQGSSNSLQSAGGSGQSNALLEALNSSEDDEDEESEDYTTATDQLEVFLDLIDRATTNFETPQEEALIDASVLFQTE